jgi:hypothetical protein
VTLKTGYLALSGVFLRFEAGILPILDKAMPEQAIVPR